MCKVLVSIKDKPSFSKKDLSYMDDVEWISEDEWLKLENEGNEIILMEVDDAETGYGFAYNCFVFET